MSEYRTTVFALDVLCSTTLNKIGKLMKTTFAGTTNYVVKNGKNGQKTEKFDGNGQNLGENLENGQ